MPFLQDLPGNWEDSSDIQVFESVKATGTLLGITGITGKLNEYENIRKIWMANPDISCGRDDFARPG